MERKCSRCGEKCESICDDPKCNSEHLCTKCAMALLASGFYRNRDDEEKAET